MQDAFSNHPQTATRQAHRLAEDTLRPGAIAIDGTVGNGHDTVFLAERVGEEGHVFGWDIQREALRVARHNLFLKGLLKRATLFQETHENIASKLPADVHGKVSVAMFNLGYLPGGDKAIVTSPGSTLKAINEAFALLKSGGLLTVVCYSGHPGGEAETKAVCGWAREREKQAQAIVHFHEAPVGRKAPPLLIALTRR